MKNTVEGIAVIRVVFLIGQLGKGGSERQLFLLLKHMDRSQVVPSVVVFNPSPNETYRPALEDLGIEVTEMPSGTKGRLRRARWLFRYLRRISPDVVHSWTVHDNPFAGIIGAVAGIPVRIGSVRGSVRSDGFRSLHSVLRYLSLHSVSGLVVNSVAIRDELLENGVKRSTVVVLQNCVEDPAAAIAAADLGEFNIRKEHVVVGIVGNLRPVKNHLLFVRAMGVAINSRPNVRALIVGHPISSFPGIRDSIAAEIRRLGLARKIFLTGFRADVPAVMGRLDILCLTSDNEGMPNVVLEAMVAGVPVVSTAVGGVPEIVEDGGTGYLVPVGDEEGLALRIGALVDDPDLRRLLGERGRKRVASENDCVRQAGRLASHYQRLMQSFVRGRKSPTVERKKA